MKTLEQKAKAYDEALERYKARQEYECQEVHEFIEYLFPELKESEDERIRKALIRYFTLSDDNADYQCCGVYYKDIVAWLERKEYKPIEWSEEDESHIKRIIEHFEGRKKDLKTQWVAELHNKEIDWLKHLKDRVLLQPRQEWSEEDKRKIDRIYSILRQAADTHAFSTSCRLIGDKECIELQDFLKSLSPQSHWKPSEREKEALLWCVVHLGGADKQTLGELLEELNKL